MDAREELKRWIATVVELSADEESKVIKQDIDVLLSAAGTLTGKLADRNTSLAKQIRPRSMSAPHLKPSPQKAQKEPEPSPSSDDSPASQNDAEDRSQERSGQTLAAEQRSEPSARVADHATSTAWRMFTVTEFTMRFSFRRLRRLSDTMNDKLIQASNGCMTACLNSTSPASWWQLPRALVFSERLALRGFRSAAALGIPHPTLHSPMRRKREAHHLTSRGQQDFLPKMSTPSQYPPDGGRDSIQEFCQYNF
jgi:hypothetical protein